MRSYCPILVHMNTYQRIVSTLALSLVLCPAAGAVDWPQFRQGPNRGAVSTEPLAATLHLHWQREFATPSPAFPGDVRLRYDATYHPVVMGDTVFVPSMVTDSVTALDASTGSVRWRFFAGGPVLR